MLKIKLEPPDSHHLVAAEGWLDLGNCTEADAELENIVAPLRAHPDVLALRYQIYAQTKKWDDAWKIGRALVHSVPDDVQSWLNSAYASRRAAEGGVQIAYDSLLPAAELHPEEPVVPFNLACYSCQLGDLAGAKRWLKRAMASGNPKQIKAMALNEPDLEPLWGAMGAL